MPPAGLASNIIGTAVSRMVVDPSGVTKGVRQAETEFSRGTNRMARTVTQRMREIDNSLTSMAARIAPLSLAAGGLFAAAIQTSALFEERLVEIQARSGATAEAIEQLDDVITQQAANTIFNADQISNAYLNALTSGQSLTEALSNMPEVLDLAAAGGLDVSRAMDIATNIIAQFNETSAVTPVIVQSLNAAAASSPATISEIGDSFTNAGNVAKTFGISIEDTAATFGVFARQGIRGAEAGTLLRSMLSFMTRDTEATTSAWARLGVEIFDTQGNMRNLDAIFREVSVAMAGLSQEERILTARDIAGRFGLAGFNALNAAGGLQEMRDAMEGAATASEVAQARMDTFARQMDSLRGSVDALLKEAFTPLMQDVLLPLVKRMIEVTNSFRDFAEANPELMKVMAGAIGLIALAAPALFGLALAFKTAAFAAGGLALATGVLTAPVGLLIGVLAALALAVQTNFLGIGEALERVLGGLGQVVQDVIGFIQELTGEMNTLDGKEATAKVTVEKEGDTDLPDADAIVDVEVTPKFRMGEWTPETGDTLWDLWQASKSETGLGWEKFKELIREANPGIDLGSIQSGVPIQVPLPVAPDVEVETEGMGEQAETASQTIAEEWAAYFKSAVSTRFAGMRLGEFMGQKIAEVLNSAVTGIGDLKRFLVGGFVQTGSVDLGDGQDTVIEEYQKGLIDSIADAIFGAPDLGASITNRASDFLGNLVTQISEFIAAAGAEVGPSLTGVGDALRDLVEGVLENADERFSDFPDWFMDNVVTQLGTSVTGAVETGMAEIGKFLLGDEEAGTGNILQRLAPVATQIADTLREVVEGVLSGSAESFGDFTSWVSENVIAPVTGLASDALSSGLALLDRFLFGEGDEGNIIQRLAPTAVSIAETLSTIVKGVLEGAPAALEGFATWVQESVITPVVDAVRPAIESGLSSLGAFLFGDEEAGTGNILQRLAPVAVSIGETLRTLVETVLEGVPEAFGQFTTWVTESVIQPVVDAVRPAIESGLASIGTFLFGDAEAGTGNILQRLAPTTESIGNSIRTLVEGVISDAPAAFADFSTWFTDNVVTPVRDNILPSIGEGLANLLDATTLGEEEQAAARSVGNSIGDFIGRVFEGVANFGINVQQFITGYLDEETGEWRKGIVEKIQDALFGAPGEGGEGVSIQERFVEWLGGLFGFIGELGAGIVEGAAPYAVAIAEKVTSYASGVFGNIVQTVETWWDENVATPVSEFIRNGLAGLFAPQEAVEGETVQMASVFEPLTNAISGIPDVIAGIESLVSDNWDSIKERFEEFVTDVVGEAGSGDEAGTGIMGLIQRIGGGLPDAVKGVFDFLRDPLANLAGLFDATFRSIGQSIETWVLDRLGQVGDAIQNLRRFIEGQIDLGTLLDRLFGHGSGDSARGNPLDEFLSSFDAGSDGAVSSGATGGDGTLPASNAREYGSPDGLQVRERIEGRRYGGVGLRGRPYLIEPEAAPELFIPGQSGTFVPNADRALGTTINLTVMPQINPAAGPVEEQVDVFSRDIERELRGLGI